MTEWALDPATWSYGFATVAFVAFAVQLSLGWKGGGRSSLLLSAIVLSAFWACASFAFAIAPDAPMWSSARLFEALRMGALLGFLVMALQPADPAARAAGAGAHRAWLAITGGLMLGALIGAAPPPDLGTPMRHPGAWGYAAGLAIAIVGLVLTEQLYRRTPLQRRWNLRPLAIGLAGLFVFDVVLYADAVLFASLDFDLWAARGFAHALVIPLLVVAAARNEDWTLDVAVSRGVLTNSTVLVTVGAYLLVAAAAGYYVRYYGGSWGGTLQAVLLFAALLALAFVAVSATFRAKVRVLVAKHFFAYRYDYREEWLKFTTILSSPESEQPVQERCVSALAELVESTGGSMWARREGGDYAMVAAVNCPRVAATEPVEAPLPQFLAKSGWVVNVAEVRSDRDKYGGLQLPEWLERSEAAWLVVPLLTGDVLTGFVVLWKPRVNVDPNWEVWDLLKTAGRQVASYLTLYQTTEELLEARKFDAFNRMSAFVVHDLKNLVAQLQLMLRNAERHAANPEFQRDMLRTVEHVVDRMNQVMLQLRSGVTPVEQPRPIDLSALVRRIQSTRAHGRPGLHITADGGVWGLGHDDRLERVIAHLVQNGFEAAGEHPSVAVRVYDEGRHAVVEVADNGVGMTPEFMRDRLFKPFQSTKAMGMGIGAYESQQYVSSLGGRITVESTPGAGTTVRVYLNAVRPERPQLEQAA